MVDLGRQPFYQRLLYSDTTPYVRRSETSPRPALSGWNGFTGRSGDKSWWISKRSEWKGLWEAGKKQSPRAAITRVSGQNWSPTEDLSGFLNAARTVAVEHPYPAVLPGAVLPPLSQVYVRQQTESRRLKNVEQKNKQPDAIWVRRPAEEIVAEDAPGPRRIEDSSGFDFFGTR